MKDIFQCECIMFAWRNKKKKIIHCSWHAISWCAQISKCLLELGLSTLCLANVKGF